MSGNERTCGVERLAPTPITVTVSNAEWYCAKRCGTEIVCRFKVRVLLSSLVCLASPSGKTWRDGGGGVGVGDGTSGLVSVRVGGTLSPNW